ncbi:hypothetical protein VT06_05795 [Arsukibacterium sp. MJ3]|uniref:hypothetical protein n=1 Tax=Arsukibacterium sp. MJ3 TaxID=1632859 RepID=UPI000626F4DD|nr:hypothetical protein [Arsukibacterium sp. MJ3]KKO49756.1 hypothetical protein VT06_05795 [Arsukibacterium sp. MJ3]
MKITFSSKALATTAAALVLTISAVGYFNTSPHCENASNQTNSDVCLNVQQNWLGWIKGDSRSTQFHFVDFLELLNRLTPNSTKLQ